MKRIMNSERNYFTKREYFPGFPDVYFRKARKYTLT